MEQFLQFINTGDAAVGRPIIVERKYNEDINNRWNRHHQQCHHTTNCG
ncbi:MAG: hypothetical protein IJP74_03555 [Prevotella sp.]|nr:hypothetical protein [Prevotella sp.]